MTGYKGLYPNVVAQNKWKRLRQSQRGLLSFSKKQLQIAWFGTLTFSYLILFYCTF